MPNQKPDNVYIDYLKQLPLTHFESARVFDTLADYFYKCFISAEAQQFINLFMKPDLAQAELDNFLNVWDIEQHGADTALLLAYVMNEHPDLTFNDYTAPRLSGVKNYFRFKNLERIAEFKKVVGALNEKGIVPLVLKGGALKYLRPDLPRVMNDIDILLPDVKSYQQALKIAEDLGYHLTTAEHSTDLSKANNEGVLDIHWCMDYYIKNRDEFTAGLFKRAEKQHVFGAECFVPAKEDMLFLLLFHLAKNLRASSCRSALPYTVFDLKYLTGFNLNGDIVLDDIEMTDSGVMILTAVKFLNKLAPGLVDEAFFNKEGLKDKVSKTLLRDIFYARYVFDVKYACKGLKFLPCLKSVADFKFYLKNKVQHFITKRMIKSDRAVKWFLNWRGAL